MKRGMIASFLQLPACLDEYASLVKHASKYLGGKSDFYLSLAKAALVNFVRERTKDDHPKDVANLLSVMLGEEYGEVEPSRLAGHVPRSVHALSARPERFTTFACYEDAAGVRGRSSLQNGHTTSRQEVPAPSEKNRATPL